MIIDLNKKNNWKKGIKGQSIWINTTLEEINSRKHICLPFTARSLNDLLSFIINLIDSNNSQIEFGDNETKASISNSKLMFLYD